MEPNPTLFNKCYKTAIVLILFQSIAACNKEDVPKGRGMRDIEGTFYPTVIIGAQEWMAENLRTTTYADRTAIPLWETHDENQEDTGFYQVYPHQGISGIHSQAEMKDLYGVLYSQGAVVNNKGLCPVGWRIPELKDWEELFSFILSTHTHLKIDSFAHTLKSCRMVSSPLEADCATHIHPRWIHHGNQYGTDEFDFSALPAGCLDGWTGAIPQFTGLGSVAFFWTLLHEDNYRAPAVSVEFYHDSGGYLTFPRAASAVRCIKR